ncbi:sigma-70 family RNA polymerase sigma factor [Jannaschia seohaensis]|uniref:RNA polymerase sigma-70 factor (ECF subfamily) n=1 Tax=Jannaschia seohaensis TaxID=475081 RepID=A0A2Y9ACF3_9RHOB|nr:sigma-70 family RNA polymerase sigma factor [Jannaschia seohaensis]PWJ21236.1 RNA polymerase sigma-70 factor (ECF subfamily) [Jannaschia seohaensis]SSA41646.1 RNA polymerase sigma-70 factor, ECF subfamily [Jannaschia seohaensis]
MRDAATEEADLLARAVDGDRAAAAVLVDRLGPKLMAFSLKMTGGDRAEAEEIVQEAFLRLWRKAPDWTGDGPARLSTWLGRVAANLAVDRHRKRGRTTPLDEDAPLPDPDPGALAGLIAADRRAAIQAALAALPDRQRQAVVLRLVEGYSNPDIAATMGTGVEAVESLIARGKRRLATLLRGLDEEERNGTDG